MQNDFFKKINVSTRIIVLVFIIISIILAKSLYYLGFITILFTILFLLTNKSVKYYKDAIITSGFWLLFGTIAYIIVMGNVLYSIIFVYKFLLILLYIKQFSFTVKFEDLCNGIKTLFYKIKIYSNNVSYNITLVIYFIKFYIESKKIILKKYNNYKKIYYICSFKYRFLPCILMATKKSKELEFALKIKNYSPQVENKNVNSQIVLYLSIVIFIIVVLKEVIL